MEGLGFVSLGGFVSRGGFKDHGRDRGRCDRMRSVRGKVLWRMMSVEADSSAQLPNSMEDAMEKAAGAFDAARKNGVERMTIEVDLTVGDETYTLLKNTLPMVKQLAETSFGEKGDGLRVVFPDEGSAALAVCTVVTEVSKNGVSWPGFVPTESVAA